MLKKVILLKMAGNHKGPIDEMRILAVQTLLNKGMIKTLDDVFEIVPKTVIATEFNMNYQSWIKQIAYPERITMKLVLQLGEYFLVDTSKITTIIENSILAKRKLRKNG